MAEDPRAALLGAQDRERPEQLPKSLHAKAKRALQDIWMAETKADAVAALAAFAETYGTKYEKAADCLTRDCDSARFYDFPAEH